MSTIGSTRDHLGISDIGTTPASGGGSGEVAWGPDFGGTDGDQFNVGVSGPSLTALALEGEQTVGVAPALTSLVAVYEPNGVGASATMDTLALEGNTAGVGASFGTDGTLAIDAFNNAAAGAWSDPIWTPAFTAPDKDCTIIQGSAVNQDGLTLISLDAVSGDSEIYLSFPLNTGGVDLPANPTVTAATLTFFLAVAQVGANTMDTFGLADADDASPGWGETTITGSNEPATSGASKQSFTVANLQGIGSTQAIVLNSTWLTFLQGKLTSNIAFVTFVIKPNTASGLSTFSSRTGANPPTLSLTFLTPK